MARLVRFPRLRALLWLQDELYASHGYELVRARVQDPRVLEWQSVAKFHPPLRRRISVTNRLSARLFRDGFHALAVLPSGAIVGAVPESIVTLRPGALEFQRTHAITRGTRPLHITAGPGGMVYWGEYFDNAARDEVHIYASADGGATWSVIYTFPRCSIRHVHNIVHDKWGNCLSADGGATWSVIYTFPRCSIRHVHNIVHDKWGNCLWILTGDCGDECRILRAACDFSIVDTVMQGNQQARAVAAVVTPERVFFSSDTPLESNYIYCLDRAGNLSQLTAISSSSIYGCRVGNQVFFTTMVEPSEVNKDRSVRVYGADAASAGNPESWQPVWSWRKDFLPMGLFQYGNAFLPDGENVTSFLAVSTIAVESDDQCLSLYEIQRPEPTLS